MSECEIEIGKELLEEYSNLSMKDTSGMLLLLDKMADYLTDIIYCE